MLVKLDHFPNFRGEHKKYLSCHLLGLPSRCYYQCIVEASLLHVALVIEIRQAEWEDSDSAGTVGELFLLGWNFTYPPVN